jgi:hypothetical protein
MLRDFVVQYDSSRIIRSNRVAPQIRVEVVGDGEGVRKPRVRILGPQ